jgi:hypothetical protein
MVRVSCPWGGRLRPVVAQGPALVQARPARSTAHARWGRSRPVRSRRGGACAGSRPGPLGGRPVRRTYSGPCSRRALRRRGGGRRPIGLPVPGVEQAAGPGAVSGGPRVTAQRWAAALPLRHDHRPWTDRRMHGEDPVCFLTCRVVQPAGRASA